MIKCPVCGQAKARRYLKDVESVYSSRPHDIYHCANCGHFFTHPLASSKELDDIYKNKYSYAAHSLIIPEKAARAKKYARYIRSQGAKNVLEIGCMHGLLLKELGHEGVKASGIELDAEAVKSCQAAGLDVKQGTLESWAKSRSGKKYDAIIMSHVLEHIVEPKKQMELLKKNLSTNGKLIIIVPNSMAASRKLFGRNWGYWQVPIHINHFNGKSITKLLQDSGFKIKNIKYVGADSLFFLSTMANGVGAKNDSNDLSAVKKIAVKTASVVLRPWFYAGSEDMIVTAQKI